jgi:hypothetical protein
MSAAQREASLVGAEVCLKARDVGSRFKHAEDDWAPMVFVWRDGGVRALFHVAIPDVSDPQLRDGVFRHVVPTLIRENGGTAAAIVTSSWIVTAEDTDMTAAELHSRVGGSLADLPTRKEVLVVTAADAEGVVCWMAEIKRDGSTPPVLGEWELWEHELDGRLSAGLLSGVR